MKRNSVIILAALTVLLLVTAYSQTTKSVAIKKVQVTTQTIASLGASKSYVIDLTRSGTVYDVAPGINYSRVQVRAATGAVLSLPEFLNKAAASGKKLNTSKNLRLGTVADLYATQFPSGGTVKPSSILSCFGTICFCRGDKDCNHMFESKICPDSAPASCSGSGDNAECWCFKS